jgi:hypothetical protein
MRDFPYRRTNMGHSFMCVYGVISYGRFKMWDVRWEIQTRPLPWGLMVCVKRQIGRSNFHRRKLRIPTVKIIHLYTVCHKFTPFFTCFTSLDIHTVRPIKPVTTTAPRNREINRKLTSRDEPLAVIEAPRANFFLDSFLVKKHRRFMRV